MPLPFDVHAAPGGRLETTRLVLRPFVADDVDAVAVYQSDAEALRFMLWPVRTRDESVEHLDRRARMTRLVEDGDSLVLAVAPRELDGRAVGEVNLRLTSAEHRQIEIGWIISPEHQGRGYAREAATRLLELCFDELDAHRVHAQLDPRNAASVGLCRRLGMREEAHFVEDMFLKGEWADTGVYALLASEWRA